MGCAEYIVKVLLEGPVDVDRLEGILATRLKELVAAYPQWNDFYKVAAGDEVLAPYIQFNPFIPGGTATLGSYNSTSRKIRLQAAGYEPARDLPGWLSTLSHELVHYQQHALTGFRKGWGYTPTKQHRRFATRFNKQAKFGNMSNADYQVGQQRSYSRYLADPIEVGAFAREAQRGGKDTSVNYKKYAPAKAYNRFLKTKYQYAQQAQSKSPTKMVEALLEDNEGNTPPPGSVVAVQDDALTYHENAVSFQAHLAEEGYQTLEQYLQDGGAVFTRDNSGSVRLLAQRIPLSIGSDTQRALQETFRFTPDTRIGYQRGQDAPVTEQPFSALSAQPKRNETLRPGKFTLGFSYPAGTQNGVLVRRVDNGTPAAKAGLKPNDVIRATGHFTALKGGSHPPVSILTGKHLEWVLRQLAPHTVLPLLVIRAGGEITIPLVPDYSEEPDNSPGGAATGLARPNEPDTVAKTGNQRANVSAIT